MEELEREFIRSCMQFHKVRMYELVPDLNRGEMMVMGGTARLQCRDPEHKVRMSDLLAVSRMTAPGLSRILRGLEKKGLMERTQDPNDRRVTLISFTEKGIEKWQGDHAILHRFCSELIHRIGEERIREIIRLNDEIYHTADEIYHEQLAEMKRKRQDKEAEKK
ncbi:MAG: MarR family winged helix-turn-helix transcriptional regulator [Eubacterium sp.]